MTNTTAPAMPAECFIDRALYALSAATADDQRADLITAATVTAGGIDALAVLGQTLDGFPVADVVADAIAREAADAMRTAPSAALTAVAA
ncbi:hypothetical protein [Microbacterium sp. NPDC077184]|uniref:hypothetical protein n=1 Tax=Microbacterium sp. NPDC077184 TaxID=3154764 RepID=UPI00343F4796